MPSWAPRGAVPVEDALIELGRTVWLCGKIRAKYTPEMSGDTVTVLEFVHTSNIVIDHIGEDWTVISGSDYCFRGRPYPVIDYNGKGVVAIDIYSLEDIY